MTPEQAAGMQRKEAFDDLIRKEQVAAKKASKKRKSYEEIRAARAIDPIISMARHSQLDHDQVRAAREFREAFDMAGGSLGSTLDLDKVRATGFGSPSPTLMAGAERLADASKLLGELPYAVVKKIVGVGMTISECSLSIHTATNDRRRRSENRQLTATLLKDSLSRLARHWFGSGGREGRIRADLAEGAKPVAQAEMHSAIEPGKVAHATGRRVFQR